jgi:hypothetical protein
MVRDRLRGIVVDYGTEYSWGFPLFVWTCVPYGRAFHH